jgi:hypothetical protein
MRASRKDGDGKGGELRGKKTVLTVVMIMMD